MEITCKECGLLSKTSFIRDKKSIYYCNKLKSPKMEITIDFNICKLFKPIK